MREAIPAGERLALTLRFLATGETYHSLSYQFRISRQAISYIVLEVCTAISKVIGSTSLKTPQSKEEWLQISEAFNGRWNYPNCIGAIDGKHIVLSQPSNSGSHFRNYKGSDSIVLLAIVGPNYEFLFVDVGANGRMSDGGIWNRSIFKSYLENTESDSPLSIPKPCPLPLRALPVPFHLVGDEAFSLKEFLMKPYPQSQLNNDENRIFNYRLSRCRWVSENAFGILARKFQVFLSKISLSPEKATTIVLAATSLHNWLRSPYENTHGHFNQDDTVQECQPTASPTDTWFPFIPFGSNNYNGRSKAIREELKEYFNNEGHVTWQWRMCGL